MRWSICGVLLVAVAAAVSAREWGLKRHGRGVDSPLLTTIAKLVIHSFMEQRKIAAASWYCYDLDTLAEEANAFNEIAIFAEGYNKENKTFDEGKLVLLSMNEERTKGRYCVVADNKNLLTPINDKIMLVTSDSELFYSRTVSGRDPFTVSEGFNKLKATLITMGIDDKVTLDHPAMIFNHGEARVELLYREAIRGYRGIHTG